MQEEIFEITSPCEAYVAPINHLLAQLSSSPVYFTIDELRAIVESPASHLFLLQADGAVVGMITLATYPAPTGRKYWIEDVVVDSAMRGRDYGRRLVQYAIEFAKEEGAGVLMLTSRPARVAANMLYRKVGFQTKETNVYRMAVSCDEEQLLNN